MISRADRNQERVEMKKNLLVKTCERGWNILCMMKMRPLQEVKDDIVTCVVDKVVKGNAPC